MVRIWKRIQVSKGEKWMNEWMIANEAELGTNGGLNSFSAAAHAKIYQYKYMLRVNDGNMVGFSLICCSIPSSLLYFGPPLSAQTHNLSNAMDETMIYSIIIIIIISKKFRSVTKLSFYFAWFFPLFFYSLYFIIWSLVVAVVVHLYVQTAAATTYFNIYAVKEIFNRYIDDVLVIIKCPQFTKNDELQYISRRGYASRAQSFCRCTAFALCVII